MKTIIPIEIFPIEDDGFHLKVSVMINGRPANLILDTGASCSVFDEVKIADYVKPESIVEQERLSSGLGTNTMESKKVEVGKFKIGAIEVDSYNAAVLDLTHINLSYEKLGLEPVVGVLGSDILVAYNAVIDYGEKVLELFYKPKK